MFVTALLAVVLAGPDSTAVIQSCKRPLAPLGLMNAQAEIALHVDRQGRIARDSIRVLSSSGASHAGVLSYLQRLLPACRVTLGRDLRVSTGTWFTQYVDLASAKAPRDSALRVVAAAPGAALVSDSAPPPAGPLPAGDPRVDERPRVTRCDRPRTFSRTVQLPASGINQAITTQALPPSRVRLRYVVQADGTVQRESVRVLEVVGADYASEAQAHIGSCRFAPARSRGHPVAVIVDSNESFGGQ